MNTILVYKYIDLCKIFEQPIKSSGRGRIDQIRFWSNFINIQLVGRKYRIIEIYDTPLKSLDELYNFLQKRQNKNTKNTDILQ